jgi:hypothetical protein
VHPVTRLGTCQLGFDLPSQTERMDSGSENDTNVDRTVVSPLRLAKSEEDILRQYDRLQELKLEIALLKAQQSLSPGK